MEDEIKISEKEKERRRKISEYRKRVMEEKREKGLKEYQKKRKKEKALKEKKKEKEKEKKKKKKAKDAEKKKKKRPVGRPKKRGPKKKKYRNASNSRRFYIFNRHAASGTNCENEENIYPTDKIKLIEENLNEGAETFNGYIYKYTFPNGKVYIGQTTKTVEERFQAHVKGCWRACPQRCDIAIRKYGPENVVVETLESLKCNDYDLLIDALDELETYYIRLYKSNFVEYGYNLTIGGRAQLSRHIKLDKKTLKTVWEEIRNPNAKKRGKKELPPFTHVIISCKNGKQNKFIGQYRTKEEAYEAFNCLKKAEEKILFPISFTGSDNIKESVDEYALLSFMDDNEDKKKYKKKNNDICKVIDSFRYYREETFWVWGYDNKSDRKTFGWVLDNIVLKNIRPKYVNNTYKDILTYKNKVVIKSNAGCADIVFCKNETDAQKFYELLFKFAKRNRLNSLKFCGDFSKISNDRRKLEQELMDVTGYSKRKIQMKANSFFMS